MSCTYTPVPMAPGVIVYDESGVPVPANGPGAWYEKVCHDQSGSLAFGGSVFIPDRSPVDLAAEARRRLRLPAPTVSLSPPPDVMLVVQFPTWLWVDPAVWRPLSSSVSVPGVSVTVTARPVNVVWSMGDGNRVTCAGPGVAYNPGLPDEIQRTYCSHTYRLTSAREPDQRFEVTATLNWRVAWSVSGAAGGGDLGTVPRTSAPVSVRVGEIQVVNTGGQS